MFLFLFLYNSETVKFGHVTFFWNGNRSGYFNSEKEEYVEIPSDSGITFNVKPKMKALEVGEKARDAILSGKFDQVNHFIYHIVNPKRVRPFRIFGSLSY